MVIKSHGSKLLGMVLVTVSVLLLISCTEVEKYPDVPSTLNKKIVPEKPIQPIGYPTELKTIGGRTHASFYKWRSVNGAPPFIPHEIDNKWKNANDCLSCHKNGGFVMKWKKFTPPMPHDFIGECRMCHNPPYPGYKDGGLATKGAPALNNIVAPGAPPQIPHSTAMRKNCVSCHFGPTAIKEVASPHEERANCTACHQPLAL